MTTAADQGDGHEHVDDHDQARLARIALAHLVEPGNRDLGELVRHVGPVEALHRLRLGEVPDRLRGKAEVRMATVDPYHLARQAVDRATRLGARILTPESGEWPHRLDDLILLSRESSDPIRRDTDPPHCVWVRGAWPLDEACERSVAIVGARASTAYGDHVAGDLGYGLAQRGWAVVSGGAFGIDAAAHRGALAAGGCTIAVLACGIDRPYPVGHASLFDRIADDGLLLSEWPLGADPHRRRFLIRNRVIAAVTKGTIMVEANLRSGARFTLNRARDLSRHALVVPGPATSAMSVGCHEEIRDGATLVATVDHVVDAVGRMGADAAPLLRAVESARDRLTELQRQVLDGVRPRKILSAEDIAAAAGVSARDARRTLPVLELAGFVVARGGGYRLSRERDGSDHGTGQAAG